MRLHGIFLGPGRRHRSTPGVWCDLFRPHQKMHSFKCRTRDGQSETAGSSSELLIYSMPSHRGENTLRVGWN
ncbi:MAG: hypothetical protein A3H94_08510 [Acidobacteria bacterium RIFCSPLOWO2_02_FULL_60_20]|nr:MAG: hypothetical protein A3H94_08510 [Acidobacteria bacterium RIFCSPLOWO2_02_FULL_60_20]